MTLQYAIAAVVGLALAGGCTRNSTGDMRAAHERKRLGGDAPSDVGTGPAERAVERLATKWDGGEFAEPGSASAEDLSRNYERLTLMTKMPVPVDQEIFLLCSSSAIEQAAGESRKRAGPHALTTLRVFMNDTAATTFRDSVKRYPTGAVIIKEKRGAFDHGNARFRNRSQTSLGVAGMIKRAAGYDPAHGDWEYFYYDEASKLTHGRIASCIECHQRSANSDYIFGDWAFGDETESDLGTSAIAAP